MLKTIFINRFFYPDHSATSQLLTDLAFNLAEQSGDIHVITSRQRYDDAKAGLPKLERIEGVQVHRVWTSSFGRRWLPGRVVDYMTFYLSVTWSLFCLVRAGDIVVAKTDPPMISIFAAAIVKLRKAVLINWVQDLFPEVAGAFGIEAMNGPIGKLLRSIRNASLRMAGKNIVLGERMAARLSSEGVACEKIDVIHNWAVGDLKAPIPLNENSLRKEWGLDDKFVVAYSGNMGRVHDFRTILDAASILKPFNEILFLFIGGGPRREWVKSEVKRLGLGNVMFKPYQPQERLQESLSVANIHLISLLPEMEGLVVPSKFYGIIAAGRPALFIGDEQGDIARILMSNECGWAVSIGESEVLANKIKECVENRALCEQWSQNARQLFDQRFDRKVALSAWQRVIFGIALK